MALSLKEARDIISNSPFVKEINDLTCTISYPYLNMQFELKGLYNIYKYFYEQFVGWENLKKENPGYVFDHSHQYYRNVLAALQQFIKRELVNSNTSPKTLLPLFSRNVQSLIRNQRGSYPFPFDSPEADFLTGLQSKSPDLAGSAFNYLTGINQNRDNSSSLEGAIMAYEFKNQDNSAIFNRRIKEKKSLDRLRSRFESLSNEYQNELTVYIAKLKEDFHIHTSELEEFKNAKEKSITDWFITKKGEIEFFIAEAKNDIENIQASYRDKLKLEEPIKYWADRATALREKGNWLLGGIIGTSLLFAVGVYFLLWHTPADMLESIFDGDRTAAIRWSLVFVIFVSIFFVVARAFLKFMFSNFHLARDAEEREKLTYLYLSMIEKGALDEEERKIILQSLFSRSDTGLLKENSSPTMPNVGGLISRQ
ncbi:DUF6161 domain-containing protein [Sphingobacterium gobiense]|uniref:DUF6161 domain-containing protein n=1 Tax=Sphingobacterium gobiense TaxID=1382456 RepID=A0A2S9JTY0_9SPHI|nr:DUF6161 domain-containing protein [Sphingobacterium gobiense]PRD56742.1 hypothetical protein C5749_05805 [Sphingobacterium gobiense]